MKKGDEGKVDGLGGWRRFTLEASRWFLESVHDQLT